MLVLKHISPALLALLHHSPHNYFRMTVHLCQDEWLLRDGQTSPDPINIKPMGEREGGREGIKGGRGGEKERVLLPSHKYESVQS